MTAEQTNKVWVMLNSSDEEMQKLGLNIWFGERISWPPLNTWGGGWKAWINVPVRCSNGITEIQTYVSISELIFTAKGEIWKQEVNHYNDDTRNSRENIQNADGH